MARTNIDIVVTVRDGASAPLTKVEQKLRATGKAVKDTSADFTQFNKTLFTTGAFIGAFIGAFNKLKASVEFGAELDKATAQFERVLGPRGEFIKSLQQSSNITVNETEAMQSALHLGMLGIVKDGTQAGDMLSKMAVTGAMLGKDPTTAVKDLSAALVDGNVAIFQQYGMINKNSAGYMALTAALNKAGGAYGNLYVKQMQIALVTKLLTEHTKNHMFMMLSTGQVVEAFGAQFNNAKRHIGIFLATAIRPLLEKMIPLLFQFKEFLADTYKSNKNIMFLTRTFMTLGTVLTGLIATLGTLKLAVKLLGFAGVGLPGLLFGTLALTASFIGLTKGADGVIEKLNVLGAIFKGIYELVTNLDPETGMSKISKSTKDLLEKYGLLGFVETISRIVAVIKRVVQDIGQALSVVGKIIDKAFGGIFQVFIDQFSDFTKGWTTWWTTDALSPIGKLARSATAILSGLFAVVGIKLLGNLASKALSKVPIIGGLFGGGEKGPKGTSTDPIYTVAVGGIVGKAIGGLSNIPFIKNILDKLGAAFSNLILKSNFLAEILTNPAGKLAGLWTALSAAAMSLVANLGIVLMSTIPELVLMLGVAGATAVTALLGVVALAVGYGIGKVFNYILEEFFPSLNEGINKVLFDMLALLPGIDRSDFATAEEAGIKKTDKAKKENKDEKKDKGQHSFLDLSTKNSDDTAIVQAVGEQMQSMSQSSRNNMQGLIESALATKENGRFISPEELEALKNAYSSALKTDPNLKAIAENTAPVFGKKTPGRND